MDEYLSELTVCLMVFDDQGTKSKRTGASTTQTCYERVSARCLLNQSTHGIILFDNAES